MGIDDMKHVAVPIAGRKLIIHNKFGYEVRTNLTEEDLAKFFASEEKLLAYFKTAGALVGVSTPATSAMSTPQYRYVDVPRFGNEEWLNRAACKDIGVEFTPIIEYKRVSYREILARARKTEVFGDIMECLDICSTCPVATECFKHSIRDRGPAASGEAGIWAGTLDPHRRAMLRMRRNKRDGVDTITNRVTGFDNGTLDPDVLVCSRCLYPSNEDALHEDERYNLTCPGAVTGIRAGDVLSAIYEPIEQKLVKM